MVDGSYRGFSVISRLHFLAQILLQNAFLFSCRGAIAIRLRITFLSTTILERYV